MGPAPAYAHGMSDARDATLRIVVGIDGSDISQKALERAVLEAQAHGATLEAVHAWNFLDQPGPEFEPDYGEDKAGQRMQAFIDGALGAPAPVPIKLTLVNDHPAPALLVAAEGAFTLVVGARGIGGFRGLMLGSVSRHVIAHSPCPALVVR
jgi:nucleotide-binding universal stress UspA family protein